MGKTFYYSDPLNDDFAGTNIRRRPLPDDYRYIPKSKIRRGVAWFLHHIVATPFAWLFLKISASQKVVGKEKLKPYRRSGYFLYGNHTRAAGDAFTPTSIAFPRKPYILVNPDALSIRGIRRIVEDLGGMPVPDSFPLAKKFREAVKERMDRGDVIAVYPEAHIWPLYTGIRPFADTSFAYPVETGKPVFTFTTTYQKRRLGGYRATVYVDGPFFPDETLSRREQKSKIREQAYAAMEERSKLSTYSPNLYLESPGA